MKTKIIDGLIAILSLMIFIVSYFYKIDFQKLIICFISAILFFIFIYEFLKKDIDEGYKIKEERYNPLSDQIMELALLNEENIPIAFWEMYGKSSMVIGLDVGENKVDVNLLNTTYASIIDIEHAVLNYANGNWYIEDLGTKNGTSIVKKDKKKYALTIGKPCLVEKGDIIYISLTKLQLR